jgi:hypothetical protein
MTHLLVLAVLLAAGGGITYFVCRRLVAWLLQVLASGAAESEMYGVEGRTALVALFRALVLLYFAMGWVAFCVAATHSAAAQAGNWTWWLYFGVSFIWCELILARAVNQLGDRDAALHVSRGTYHTDKIWAAGLSISLVLSWGSIVAFVVFGVWPQLIPIGYGWVEWLTSNG